MFKNFWYAIELSQNLAEKPRRVKALGQNLAVFRNQRGEPVVMSDVCVHRGGSLSMGQVEDGCLRCPYHGWKYDASGKCVEIPANTSRKTLPQRARTDAYPSLDRYGLVWAFLGDLPEAERPPLPEFPAFDDDAYAPLWGTFDWNANYERVVENGIDIAHAPWVHAKSFGNPEKPEVQDYSIESKGWGFRATVALESPSRNFFGRKRGTRMVYSTVGVQMPHVTTLDLDLPNGFKMRLFDANLPVDRDHTRTFWVMARNFMKGRWADPFSRRSVMKIFWEDQPFVESQTPELVPRELSAEVHVKADAAQLSYRRLRDRALAQGYGLAAMQPRPEERVEVIAGPSRRDPNGADSWVFDEVQTVEEMDKRAAE